MIEIKIMHTSTNLTASELTVFNPIRCGCYHLISSTVASGKSEQNVVAAECSFEHNENTTNLSGRAARVLLQRTGLESAPKQSGQHTCFRSEAAACARAQPSAPAHSHWIGLGVFGGGACAPRHLACKRAPALRSWRWRLLLEGLQ
jgi:hypothetical protein